MSALAIGVHDLGKRYRLGERERYKSLRETLTRLAAQVRKPWALWRQGTAAADGTHLWALRHVDFDVQQGEVVGIIGHNGAGKTTVLKLLSRITEPTEGRAEIRGRVGSLLEVGTGFHPELTGRENIFLNATILGMKRAEVRRKFDEIVSFAEVEPFIDTPVKRYSTGMFMRLAFSVAAHLEPEILIVDEVLAVGDSSFQQKCLRKLGEVGDEGRTVLFVSHNLAAIRSLTRRCLWVDHGRIKMDGPSAQVVESYCDSTTALSVAEAGPTDLRRPELRTHYKGCLGAIRFVSIDLRTTEGTSSRHFVEGEPLQLEFELTSSTETQLLEVWFEIKTRDGLLLFTCISGPETCNLGAGAYRLRAVLDRNPLRAGQYILGLRARTGVLQDAIPEALTFAIDPGEFDNPFQAADVGLINAESSWTPAEPCGSGTALPAVEALP